MLPNSTPEDVMAKVIEMCQVFEKMDMHGFVVFANKASPADVTACGTRSAAKFLVANSDLGKSFGMFCTNWTNGKEVRSASNSHSTDNTSGAPCVEIKVEKELVDDAAFDTQSGPNVNLGPFQQDGYTAVVKKEDEAETQGEQACNKQIESENGKKVCQQVNVPKLTAPPNTCREHVKKCIDKNLSTDRLASKTVYVVVHQKDIVNRPEKCAEKKPIVERRSKVKKKYPCQRAKKADPYKCPMCEMEFQSRSGLYLHKGRIHSKIKYPCPSCGRCFGLTRDLRKHEKSHTNEFTCRHCNKVLSSSRMLREHENGHTKANRYICDRCGAEFYSKMTLSHHRRRHFFKYIPPNKYTKSYTCHCPYCDETFRSYYALGNHLRHKHLESALADGSRYIQKCNVCNKIVLGQFKKHMDIHNGIELHKCHMCSAQYAYKCNLKVHMSDVHGMEKIHCKFCRRVFLSSDELDSHMSLKHSRPLDSEMDSGLPVTSLKHNQPLDSEVDSGLTVKSSKHNQPLDSEMDSGLPVTSSKQNQPLDSGLPVTSPKHNLPWDSEMDSDLPVMSSKHTQTAFGF